MERYLQQLAFLEWLQDNNIAEMYFNNALKVNGNISAFFASRDTLRNIISVSFVWIDTEEDYDFWANKNVDWNNYLEKFDEEHHTFLIKSYNIFQYIPIESIKACIGNNRAVSQFEFDDLRFGIGKVSDDCYYLACHSGLSSGAIIDRLGISKSTLRFLFPKSSSIFCESFKTDCKASPEFCSVESLCKYIGLLFQAADKEHEYSIPRTPFEALDAPELCGCKTPTIKLTCSKPSEEMKAMKDVIESVIKETKGESHLEPEESLVKDESFKLSIKPKKAVHIIL